MKRLINSSILWIVSILLIMLGCSDDVVTPQESRESQISFDLSVFPDIGSTETPFKIVPVNFTEESGLVSFKFKYDFDGDGTFDTDWVNNDTLIHNYETTGKKTINVEFKDHLGETKKYESTVYVGILEKVQGTDPARNINEPNFAKDGTNRIVYNTYDEGHQLFIANLDTKSVTQLTTNDGSEGNNCKHVPDWSPDGNNIAVLYKQAVYLVDTNDGNLEKISNFDPFYLEFSPDGKNLLIVCDENDGSTYIMNLEDKMARQFSNRFNGVCWSPDGTQIAEFDYSNGEVKILNVNDGSLIKTYKAENLQRLGDRANYMDWSADGKWIHLCHYGALLNTETGKFYSIVPGVFKRKQWAESSMNRDATMIAFTNSKEENQVDPIYLFKIPSELKE